MENSENIGYSTDLNITVYFKLHHKVNGEEFTISTEDFNGVEDDNGTTVISYPLYFPKEEVIETVEEVKALYKRALDKKEELYDTLTIIQRIPDSEIWNFCSKTSHEWWQMIMNIWNTLSDEEQKKYNQFIGFNDFSDYLMNIMAGALMKLRDTGKLDYEEGSLLLEKQKQKPCDIGTCNNVSMLSQEQLRNDLSVIHELVEKTKSDSKKESADAKCELIDICEPIIKRYCMAIESYIVEITNDCKLVGDCELRQTYFDPNYQYNQGSIDDFIGYYDSKLLFIYRDFCLGNEFVCNVCMPIQWLNVEQFDMNMNNIKEKVLNEYIEMQKRQIDDYRHCIVIHEEEIRKSEAKLEELQKLI